MLSVVTRLDTSLIATLSRKALNVGGTGSMAITRAFSTLLAVIEVRRCRLTDRLS